LNIAEFNQPVSGNIIRVIDEKGLKQKHVAEKAGYTKQQFNSMLNGRKLIKPVDIVNIAATLNVDANELLKKEG